MNENTLNIVVPQFSVPGEGFEHFAHEIRILHEILSLEPDSQVWNRKSSPQNLKFILEAQSAADRRPQQAGCRQYVMR